MKLYRLDFIIIVCIENKTTTSFVEDRIKSKERSLQWQFTFSKKLIHSADSGSADLPYVVLYVDPVTSCV